MDRSSLSPVRLEDLKQVLEGAAEIVRSFYRKGEPASRKADGSPLTRADMGSNDFLRRELSRLLPQAGWLSEESTDDPARLDTEWVWVVDPLDGTREFARRVPEFAVSVGLVRGRHVVAGGIINPVSGEGGVGAAGGDVRFWGLTPRPTAARTLDNATASVSRSESEDRSVAPYLDLVGTTRPVGSVAYKLLRVAAGVEDLTFSVQHKSEWDICGGAGLLAAAGKVYRRFDGRPLHFNRPDTRVRSGAAAGPEALVDELIQHLSTRRPLVAPCRA